MAKGGQADEIPPSHMLFQFTTHVVVRKQTQRWSACSGRTLEVEEGLHPRPCPQIHGLWVTCMDCGQGRYHSAT